MQIHIDKRSEVSARVQLRQQIIFLIATGELAIGAELPSVRQLARRLKVHHNTVSHAYSQLAREGWLIKKRGSRLSVGQAAKSGIEDFNDLDGLIDRTICLARDHGYSLQQLTMRVRARLLAEPSDHLLIVAPEKNLAELIKAEIAEATGLEAEGCSASILQQNPSVKIGAIVVTPSHSAATVRSAVSADRTVIPISYSSADEHIATIRDLPRPAAIAVISVSAVFLETANGLLAPVIGRRHSFREFLLQKSDGRGGRWKLTDYVANGQPLEIQEAWRLRDEGIGEEVSLDSGGAPRELPVPNDLRGFDLLFCDSLSYPKVKHRGSLRYRLVSKESLAEIENVAIGMMQPK